MMTLIFSAATIGAVYALVATGYNIVFIASDVFNFAHAQLMMLGVFLAYAGLAILHWSAWEVFLFAGAVVAVLAVVEERIAIRPVRSNEAVLVTTVGVATLINGGTQLIWGPAPHQVPFFAVDANVTILGGQILRSEIVIIGFTVALVVLLIIFSRRTLVGLAMLAIAEDREAATLRGINIRRYGWAAFAFSGLVAGVAGPIIGPQTFASVTLATSVALYGFVALAIGGFGSLLGALIGGLAVGLAQEFAARYWGSNYSDIAVFVILMIVLLIRPNGLFGRLHERLV